MGLISLNEPGHLDGRLDPVIVVKKVGCEHIPASVENVGANGINVRPKGISALWAPAFNGHHSWVISRSSICDIDFDRVGESIMVFRVDKDIQGKAEMEAAQFVADNIPWSEEWRDTLIVPSQAGGVSVVPQRDLHKLPGDIVEAMGSSHYSVSIVPSYIIRPGAARVSIREAASEAARSGSSIMSMADIIKNVRSYASSYGSVREESTNPRIGVKALIDAILGGDIEGAPGNMIQGGDAEKEIVESSLWDLLSDTQEKEGMPPSILPVSSGIVAVLFGGGKPRSGEQFIVEFRRDEDRYKKLTARARRAAKARLSRKKNIDKWKTGRRYKGVNYGMARNISRSMLGVFSCMATAGCPPIYAKVSFKYRRYTYSDLIEASEFCLESIIRISKRGNPFLGQADDPFILDLAHDVRVAIAAAKDTISISKDPRRWEAKDARDAKRQMRYRRVPSIPSDADVKFARLVVRMSGMLSRAGFDVAPYAQHFEST